jgi:hypothetical protein
MSPDENKNKLPPEYDPNKFDLTNRLHTAHNKMVEKADDEEKAAVLAQAELDNPDWIVGWLENNEKYLLPESIEYLRTVIESKGVRLEDSELDVGPAPKSELARLAAREKVEALEDFIEAAIVTGIGESSSLEEIQQWLVEVHSEISEESREYLRLTIEFKSP